MPALTPRPRLHEEIWVLCYGWWRYGRMVWRGPKWCEVRLLRPVNRGQHSKLVRMPWNFDGAHQLISRERPTKRIGKEWR